MPTVVDLGKMVKAKYPQYANMDDAEVGRLTKSKYPQYSGYSDMPKSAPTKADMERNARRLGELKAEQAARGMKPKSAASQFLPALGETLANFDIGLLKGAGSTLAGASAVGEDILSLPQRALGVMQDERLGRKVIGSGILSPTNTAQKIGYGTEKVVEALAPVPGTGKLMAGRGILRATGRLATEGFVGGAVGGATQALGEGKTLGDTAKQALKYGIVGAVATPILGGVAGASLGTYKAIKGIVKPDMVDAFVRGVAPTGARATEFSGTAKMAMPDLYHTSRTMGKDISASSDPLNELVAVSRQAKKNIWSQVSGMMDKFGGLYVDGNEVANAMVSSLNKRFITQEPTATQAIINKANTYRRKMTIDEAEDFLESANSDLSSYYAKNKVGRSAAMGDPEKAHVVREADALRNVLESKFDAVAPKSKLGQDFKTLKKRYGALTEVQKQLYHRIAVTQRLKPLNLQETISMPYAIAKGVGSVARGDVIGAGEAVAQVAASRAMKEAQTSENMIRKAFGAAKKGKISPYSPVTTPMFTEGGQKLLGSGEGRPIITPPPKPKTTFEPRAKIIGSTDTGAKAGSLGGGEMSKMDIATSNMIEELDASAAGSRHFIQSDKPGQDYEIIGLKSTFPKWVPSELRSRASVDEVIAHLKNGTVPTGNNKTTRLYDLARRRIKDIAEYGDLFGEPNPLMGGVAGVRIEKDEKGKMRVKYDPKMGALGVAGMMLGTKAVKSGMIDDIMAQAKKFKSADDFVKAQGKIMYHGTKKSFDKFDDTKIGSNTGWLNSKWGHFFSEDKNIAKRFLTVDSQHLKNVGDDKIIEATLNLKKPLDFTPEGLTTDKKQAQIIYEALSGEKIPPDDALEYITDAYDEAINTGSVNDFFDELYKNLKIKKIAQDNGYDGLISNYGELDGKNIKEYVVFSENQIKTKSQLIDIWNKAHGKKKKLGD